MFVNINVDSVGVIVNFMFVVGAGVLASVVSMGVFVSVFVSALGVRMVGVRLVVQSYLVKYPYVR